jgi:hypothetical protein
MRPIEAAAMPLPSEDTTPPVTKMYLVLGASGTVWTPGRWAAHSWKVAPKADAFAGAVRARPQHAGCSDRGRS